MTRRQPPRWTPTNTTLRAGVGGSLLACARLAQTQVGNPTLRTDQPLYPGMGAFGTVDDCVEFATVDNPADNEHPSGWLTGSSDLSQADVTTALVRVHLDAGGYKTGLIDARLYGLYATPPPGALTITFGCRDDHPPRQHTESLAAETTEAAFTVPTGANIQNKFVRLSAESRRIPPESARSVQPASPPQERTVRRRVPFTQPARTVNDRFTLNHWRRRQLSNTPQSSTGRSPHEDRPTHPAQPGDGSPRRSE